MFRIRVLDEVESTNVEVKRAIDEGEPEGLVVRARCQTEGYGRQGRAWRSPVGGLYFSMLLRPSAPTAELPTLALTAGLAVRRALARIVRPELSDNVRVKWPNDIVVSADASELPAGMSLPFGLARRYFKLCGISSEARGGAVCVGVGVNVFAPDVPIDGEAARDAKNAPAYLAALVDEGRLQGADPESEVLRAILEEFEPLYRRWSREGFAPLAAEYAASESLRGNYVDVVDLTGAAIVTGTVEGVAADGCLLVRDEKNGVVVPVSSGEAHIV